MNKNNNEKKVLTMACIISIILLNIVPASNASFNTYQIIKKDKQKYIEVTTQVNTFLGIKETIKKIPASQVNTILELADKIKITPNINQSYESLINNIKALIIELKNADLLPKGMTEKDIVNLVENKCSKLNQENNEENMSQNLACFVYGTSRNNESFSLPAFRTFPRALLSWCVGYIKSILRGNGTQPLIPIGPLYHLWLLRPKMIMPIGIWLSLPTDSASLLTIGLKGIQQIKNSGYGIYLMAFMGFLGININFGSYGGLIIGTSLREASFFDPWYKDTSLRRNSPTPMSTKINFI